MSNAIALPEGPAVGGPGRVGRKFKCTPGIIRHPQSASAPHVITILVHINNAILDYLPQFEPLLNLAKHFSFY